MRFVIHDPNVAPVLTAATNTAAAKIVYTAAAIGTATKFT